MSTLESIVEEEVVIEEPEDVEKPVGLENGKFFTEIYAKFYPKCYSLCFKILENAADAEDVAQLGMMKVMEKIHTFQGRSALSSWIYKVIWNEIMGFMRKRKYCGNGQMILANHPDKSEVDESDPESIMLRKEMFEFVIGLLENGNSGYKNAARLRFLGDLSNDEIFEAHEGQVPISTIKSRIFRVRMELKEELIKQGYGEHLKK